MFTPDVIYCRYKEMLYTARSIGIKRGLVNGLGQGLFWLIVFSTISFGFWFGSYLHRTQGRPSVGVVIQVGPHVIICNSSAVIELCHLCTLLLIFNRFPTELQQRVYLRHNLLPITGKHRKYCVSDINVKMD